MNRKQQSNARKLVAKQTGKSTETSGQLKTAFLDAIKPIAVAVASSIAGIVAYVSTPLNELVNSMFWSESAELLLISQTPETRQGEVLYVDIFLQVRSPVPISEGILTVEYPQNLLRPSPETSRLLVQETPKISTAKRLTAKPLEFIADIAGAGEMRAELKTKFTKTPGSMQISVLPANKQVYPTRKNFTGTWNIDLGGIHGRMDIKEAARTITGQYRLNDGNGGQIEGTRDGITFRANLYRGAAPSRFAVDAIFDPNPSVDLEIQGKAKLLLPTGNTDNPWREDGVLDFNAVANVR